MTANYLVRRKLNEISDSIVGKVGAALSKVKRPAVPRFPTVAERAAKHGLTVAEQTAVDGVADHVLDYFDSAPPDAKISDWVLTSLLDSGKIAGLELIGDTLEKFNPALASALAKVDSRIPDYDPLVPVGQCEFID